MHEFENSSTQLRAALVLGAWGMLLPWTTTGECSPPASSREIWDGLIRQHDRKVVLSLIALGIDRDRARDLAQATWTRLYEQHQDGKLAALELPGLAIRQARFLAIDSFRHTALQRRTLAMTRVEVSEDGEHQLLTRDQLRRALDALGTCSSTAQQLFRLLYTPPPMTSTDAAREVGLSAERARHVVCETRKLLRKSICQASDR